jgi:outer membrane protein
LKTAFAHLPKYFAALALCWSSMAPVQAQTAAPAQPAAASRIATFSAERIYNESKLVKRAEEKLVAEFKGREGAIRDLAARLKSSGESLDKDLPTLPDAERTRRQREHFELEKEFQRKQREINEDVNQRRNEERAAIAERALKIIKKIAETEGYDVVLQDPFWFNPRIDITDKVIAALDQ